MANSGPDCPAFKFFLTMDNKFTQQISDWLNTPRTQRDINDGAMMLLRLNNNRFLYANILRRPDKFAEKLEYELRKHLRIRLDNMTMADVVRMEAQVIPAAEKTLATPPAVISTDDELPEAKVARGRREDHDRLPAEVQALWDNNLQLYKTIKNVFEQLKTMERAQPCDRYEYVKILDEADKKYRANLERYDGFVIGNEPDASHAVHAATDNATDDQSARKINAARKTLSKYKKILAKSLEQDNAENADTAKAKILDSAAAIRHAGGIVGAAVTTELLALGININDDAHA